ncbi:MAG: 2Fe-2S iron-sulfur cluster-binding protein [Candidatus Micrarchaeota archaeon]
MAKVKIKNDNISVEVPAGKSVREICDENGASIPFGCGNGVCGTCLSTITQGAENLEPASDNEKSTLQGFGVEAPRKRLVCQCKMGQKSQDVEVEYP